jgi:uncharacterized membrane protein SpoIIM required for sporulation
MKSILISIVTFIISLLAIYLAVGFGEQLLPCESTSMPSSDPNNFESQVHGCFSWIDLNFKVVELAAILTALLFAVLAWRKYKK